MCLVRLLINICNPIQFRCRILSKYPTPKLSKNNKLNLQNMKQQTKKLGLGLLLTIFLLPQINANNINTTLKSDTLKEETHTRTVTDFQTTNLPKGSEYGSFYTANEATITITSLEDQTINSIELELDFSDEIAKKLVNEQGLFKDDVTLADDFRGEVSWTLHASEDLRKTLTSYFQKNKEVNPIDIFLEMKFLPSASSSINLNNYEMYMSFNMPLSTQSSTYSYQKFIVIEPTEDKKYIEILLHRTEIFIEHNSANEVTKMSIKGLVSTKEFNEKSQDIPIFKSIVLTEENTGDNKFIAVEFQAEPGLCGFMGEQIKVNPDDKPIDIFGNGQYTGAFRTVGNYTLTDYEFQEYDLEAPETRSFVQKMILQELILEIENPAAIYAVPMSQIIFETINTRTATVGVTFEGTVTLPIAKFLKENSPVFENIELPEEPFEQLPLVRFKLKMDDEMAQSFDEYHKELKPKYKTLGIYINSPRSAEFRNIKHYKLVKMKFEHELVDNMIPILELKKLD